METFVVTKVSIIYFHHLSKKIKKHPVTIILLAKDV
jgi:hypothetical protein